MIIYSVVPMEAIMKQEAESQHSTKIEELEVGGIKMLVEKSSVAAEAKIVRLLSTNPQDFLNPQYAPGETVRYTPSW